MANDYFSNHERVRRFPWSLYHAPIENDLNRFLARVASERPRAAVLVIGCGLMQELDHLPRELQFTLADIDPRVIDAVRSRGDPRVREAFMVAAEVPPTQLGRRFDAIYAKEVIEHIVHWKEYLRGLGELLLPGGYLWLSTPNYGEPWLPLLEATVLELVARRSGFTRRGMHPSKFSRTMLRNALIEAAFTQVHVRPTRNRLTLLAQAKAPSPPQ